jgi:hypothetical protein
VGAKAKTVYVPTAATTSGGQAAAAASSYVPPASQSSPTAGAGDTAKGASAMASGLGFGGTVLTSGQGLMDKATTTSKALLGA